MLSLEEAVRLLALPASEQLASLPDFVCKPDEHALTFNQWFVWAACRSEALFSDFQWQSLQAIDALLSQMTETKDAELWTEEAVQYHAVWRQVRSLAQYALTSCGWQQEGSVGLSAEYFPARP